MNENSYVTYYLCIPILNSFYDNNISVNGEDLYYDISIDNIVGFLGITTSKIIKEKYILQNKRICDFSVINFKFPRKEEDIMKKIYEQFNAFLWDTKNEKYIDYISDVRSDAMRRVMLQQKSYFLGYRNYVDKLLDRLKYNDNTILEIGIPKFNKNKDLYKIYIPNDKYDDSVSCITESIAYNNYYRCFNNNNINKSYYEFIRTVINGYFSSFLDKKLVSDIINTLLPYIIKFMIGLKAFNEDSQLQIRLQVEDKYAVLKRINNYYESKNITDIDVLFVIDITSSDFLTYASIIYEEQFKDYIDLQ